MARSMDSESSPLWIPVSHHAFDATQHTTPQNIHILILWGERRISARIIRNHALLTAEALNQILPTQLSASPASATQKAQYPSRVLPSPRTAGRNHDATYTQARSARISLNRRIVPPSR